MKAYLATTGGLFLVVTVAHIVRVFQETHLARDPWFIVMTIAGFVLSLWALRLLRKTARP